MSEILALKDTEIIILACMNEYMKGDRNNITIEEIVNYIGIDKPIIIDGLVELKVNNYIEQDVDIEQEAVFWNDNSARYKINEIYRPEIETFLQYDTEANNVKIIGEYIWYAVYGTGILKEKFLHYIRGGICRFNHTEYEGCKDTSLPLGDRPIVIPYRAYIGGSSPLWQYKGTMLLDSKHVGMTKGRMYLIKRIQYEEIRSQLGRGKERYDEEIELGQYFGVAIKAVTNKNNKIPNESSMKYKEVMELGLEETYPNEDWKQNEDYLNLLFDYEVKLNLDNKYIEASWQREVKEIIDEMKIQNIPDKISVKDKHDLQNEIDNSPKKIITTTTLIKHSPIVRANRLIKAGGKCERCGKQSPYYKEGRDIEYLQVHYISPIEEGGKDEVDNTIALCPNCKKEVEMGILLWSIKD